MKGKGKPMTKGGAKKGAPPTMKKGAKPMGKGAPPKMSRSRQMEAEDGEV